MATVCAWCLKVLAGTGKEPGPVSHGICPECADDLEADTA